MKKKIEPYPDYDQRKLDPHTVADIYNYIADKYRPYQENHMKNLTCKHAGMDATFEDAHSISFNGPLVDNKFMIQNEYRQVISWYLSETESYQLYKPYFSLLNDRLVKLESPIQLVSVDVCCKVYKILIEAFPSLDPAKNGDGKRRVKIDP